MKLEFYKCAHCGNVAVKLFDQGVSLSCCGEEMTLLRAGETDGAAEKHVPVVTRENGKVHVQIGSVEHPMLEEHHIEWIALESEGRLVFKYLKSGDKPVADFCDAASGTVYEYCNLHGLWKTEF